MTSTENKNELSSKGMLVADNIKAMLAYWDKDLVCRFANAAYLDWFGYSREQMVDKITLDELLGPLYLLNLPYIQGALAGKPQTFERMIPVPNGEVRASLANYFPHVVNGEVKGFMVHVTDISQQKKLELELQQSNATVNEQNKRLLNFANIISHNLRSYANNLQSMLDLYADAESEKDRNVMFGHLQSIARDFRSTLQNLDEVVAIQNRADISCQSINLYLSIQQTRQLLNIQLSESMAEIRNNVDPGLTVWANPAYIESILLNLMVNAVKYRRPEVSPLIEIDALSTEKGVSLSIKDNGLGIDLAKHGKDLFGMYKTFHGNKDAKGIGLFITRYQVEAMGGSIHVESEVNKGSTFTVTFAERGAMF